MRDFNNIIEMKTLNTSGLPNKKWIFIISFTAFIVFLLIPGTILSDVPDKTVLDSFLKETVKRYRIPGLAVAVVNYKDDLAAT